MITKLQSDQYTQSESKYLNILIQIRQPCLPRSKNYVEKKQTFNESHEKEMREKEEARILT